MMMMMMRVLMRRSARESGLVAEYAWSRTGLCHRTQAYCGVIASDERTAVPLMTRCCSSTRRSTTVDEQEIAKFAAYDSGNQENQTSCVPHSERNGWWDARAGGPTAALHYMNRVRGKFTRDVLCQQFGRQITSLEPLSGLHVLEVGCGGGIFSESLARMGAKVTAIDATEECIKAANRHLDFHSSDFAKGRLSYKCMTAEQLADDLLLEDIPISSSNSSDEKVEGVTDNRFDVVVSLEVVEHVADVEVFVELLCKFVKPGGSIVMSSINRTVKSYALAVIAAERIIRWVPQGTHDWNKFVKPEELTMLWNRHGISLSNAAGMELDLRPRTLSHFGLPDIKDWKLTNDMSMNYIMAGTKTTTTNTKDD